MIDLARAREQTPAAAAGIHLNNASAGLMPSAVTAAMSAFLADERDRGHHAAAEAHEQALAQTQHDVGLVLGTREPVEFFDTVSRTMALLLGAVPWRAGDRLLVARHEWGAVADAAQQLAQRCAVSVETIPCAADTTVDTRALAARLDERVRAVCLPLHTAVGGRPTLALDLPRPADCLVFGDAAQALGQMPFHLQSSGYDVVVGTARKWLRGPRGIAFAGFSTAGQELMCRAQWLGGASSTSGVTSDYTRLLRLGLGAAAAHCLELGVENVQTAVRGLAGRIHDGLASVQGVQLLDAGPPASGIVAFTAGGREATLVEALGRHRIRVAVIEARYHPGLFQDRRMQQVVRISPHVFNTHQEIDRALEHIAHALAR